MFLRILDFVFLLRPTLLVPVWLFLCLGYTHYLQAGGRWFPVEPLPPRRLGLAWLSFTAVIGAVYVANQIFDIESDRRNEKLFILPQGIVSVRAAWIWTVILTLFSFLIAGFVGGHFFTVTVLSAALGVLYTFPPFHFKGRPVLDALSNGFGNGLLNTAAGWAAVAAIDLRFAAYTAPYVPAVMAVFLLTSIPDIPGDKRVGERTTAVVFGPRTAAVSALLLLAASVILGKIFGNWVAAVCAGVCLPFFLHAAVKMTDKAHILAYRFATLFYALVAAAFNPWLLVPILGSILLAKYYYARRFSFRFPF